MMNKKYILPVIAMTLVGSVLLGGTYVYAQTETGQTFAAKLALRLGIEEGKVQTALDDIHKEHQVEMQARIEEKLTQAVSSGKITEAQKQAILDKHKTLMASKEALREEFKDMTPEERKAMMEKEQEEMKAWADENGIDLKEFMPFGHKGMGWKMRAMH